MTMKMIENDEKDELLEELEEEIENEEEKREETHGENTIETQHIDNEEEEEEVEEEEVVEEEEKKEVEAEVEVKEVTVASREEHAYGKAGEVEEGGEEEEVKLYIKLPSHMSKYVDDIHDLVKRTVDAFVKSRKRVTHVLLGISRGKTWYYLNVIINMFQMYKKRFRFRRCFPIAYIVTPGIALQIFYSDFIEKSLQNYINEKYAHEMPEIKHVVIMGRRHYDCPYARQKGIDPKKKYLVKCYKCPYFVKWRNVEYPASAIEDVVKDIQVSESEIMFLNILGEYVDLKIPETNEIPCSYALNFKTIYDFIRANSRNFSGVLEPRFGNEVLIVIINYDAFVRHLRKLPRGFIVIVDEYDAYILDAINIRIDQKLITELVEAAKKLKSPSAAKIISTYTAIISRKTGNQPIRELLVDWLLTVRDLCYDVIRSEEIEVSEETLNFCYAVREAHELAFTKRIYYDEGIIELAFDRHPVLSIVINNSPTVLASGTPFPENTVRKLLRYVSSREGLDPFEFIEPKNPELKRPPGEVVVHLFDFMDVVTYRKLFDRHVPNRQRFIDYCSRLGKILDFIFNNPDVYLPMLILPYPYYCLMYCIQLSHDNEIREKHPEFEHFRKISPFVDKGSEEFKEVFTRFTKTCEASYLCRDLIPLLEDLKNGVKSLEGVDVDMDILKKDLVSTIRRIFESSEVGEEDAYKFCKEFSIYRDDLVKYFATNRLQRGNDLTGLRSIIFVKFPLDNITSAFAKLCSRKVGLDVLYDIAEHRVLQVIGRGVRRPYVKVHVFTPDKNVYYTLIRLGRLGLLNVKVVVHEEGGVKEEEISKFVEEAEKQIEELKKKLQEFKKEPKRIEYRQEMRIEVLEESDKEFSTVITLQQSGNSNQGNNQQTSSS